MYKGIIVEQSLKSTNVLKDIKIINTVKGESSGWIMHTVEISKKQIELLSDKIKDNWYMHFWENKEVIVVFKDKVFEINYDDKNTWKEAIEHGLSIGIPKEQLDFPIE